MMRRYRIFSWFFFLCALTFSLRSEACGIDLIKGISYEIETASCVGEGDCDGLRECPGVQKRTNITYFCQDEYANTYSYEEPGVWDVCELKPPAGLFNALKAGIKNLTKTHPTFCESYEDFEECREEEPVGPDGPYDDGEGNGSEGQEDTGPDGVGEEP